MQLSERPLVLGCTGVRGGYRSLEFVECREPTADNDNVNSLYMDIRSKLSITVGLCIALISIPGFMLLLHMARESVLERETATSLKGTGYQVSAVSARLQNVESRLLTVARDIRVQISSTGAAYNRVDRDQLASSVRQALQRRAGFAELAERSFWFASADGVVIQVDAASASSPISDVSLESQHAALLQQLPAVPAAGGRDRQVNWIPPMMDLNSDSWVVSAAYPFEYGGEWLGVVGVDIALDDALSTILLASEFYDSAANFVVDAGGNIIFSSYVSQQQHSVSISEEAFHLAVEPMIERMSLSAGSRLFSERVDIAGVPYLAIGAALDPVDWYYVKLISVDYLVGLLDGIRRIIVLGFAIVCIATALIIGLVTDRMLVVRLQRLTQAVRRYRKRDEDQTVRYQGTGDEISVLDSEFENLIIRVERQAAEVERAREEMRTAEERMELALENSATATWDWDMKNGVSSFSHHCKALFGYLPEDFSDDLRHWNSLIHPNDRAAVYANLEAVQSHQVRYYHSEFRVLCASGSYKWVLVRGTVVQAGKDGEPLRMAGIVTDISLLKSVESELRETSQQMKALLENSPVAVRIATLDGREVLFANSSYANLLEIDSADTIGVDPVRYYANAEDYAAVLEEVHSGRQVANRLIQLVDSHGHRKWSLSTYVQITYEQEQSILGWFYDVTDLVKAEESMQLHASVFENAREGILITNAQNTIMSVNQAFTEITGYRSDEVVGKQPLFIESNQQPPEFYREMWLELRRSGHWRGELWNKRKNGEMFAGQLTVSRVQNKEGKVTHYVGVFTDITERKQNENVLEKLAHYDPLTQLPNRALLSDRLEHALSATRRNRTMLAVCFIDLDGFKPVNDRYGHPAGDQLLVEIARRLEDVVRSEDTVARLGGDEFVLLLTRLSDIDELDAALERVHGAITRTVVVERQPLKVTASIGVSLYPQDDVDADTLIRHADMAMYEAKQSGRNRYHLFDASLDRQIHARHRQIERMTQALAENEFVLFYQPKVNLVSGRVLGVEALIRWQHPRRGLLEPMSFLPLIESHDLMLSLGDWVVNEAMAQVAAWKLSGFDLQVGINLAARQIEDPAFIDRLEAAFERHPSVNGDMIEFEILETSAVDADQISSLVNEASARFDVSFALDDFGTGYSSLAYLKKLPATALKIDQTFVRDMLEDMEDQAIVKGVIELARVFGRTVVAEGVETDAHASKLLEFGCEVAQGYGISKPMPADKVCAWVANYSGGLKRVDKTHVI